MTEPSATSLSATIVGATGLVGRECVLAFAAHPRVERVTAVVRRPLPPALRVARVTECDVDFDHLARRAECFAATHIVCALGTTIRQAGSQERFRQVDHDYALATARIGLERGARHFLLVSSIGASPDSRVFYSRVKGEVERDVSALGYRSVTIARPSLLDGDREERRLGERIARWIAWLAPPSYRPVPARAVAAALLRAAVEDRPGVRILESREMRLGTTGVTIQSRARVEST